MSPRAACRLESLGFKAVYDYVLGLADWKAGGEPVEGDQPVVQRVSDATRPDVPTGVTDETLGTTRRSTFDAGWDDCIVIDCGGIVVGRLQYLGEIPYSHSRGMLVKVRERLLEAIG